MCQFTVQRYQCNHVTNSVPKYCLHRTRVGSCDKKDLKNVFLAGFCKKCRATGTQPQPGLSSSVSKAETTASAKMAGNLQLAKVPTPFELQRKKAEARKLDAQKRVEESKKEKNINKDLARTNQHALWAATGRKPAPAWMTPVQASKQPASELNAQSEGQRQQPVKPKKANKKPFVRVPKRKAVSQECPKSPEPAKRSKRVVTPDRIIDLDFPSTKADSLSSVSTPSGQTFGKDIPKQLATPAPSGDIFQANQLGRPCGSGINEKNVRFCTMIRRS